MTRKQVAPKRTAKAFNPVAWEDQGLLADINLCRHPNSADNTNVNLPTDPAIEEARRVGFDMNLIEINLLLSPEERWRQHDMALEVVLELQKARMARDARLHATTTAAR